MFKTKLQNINYIMISTMWKSWFVMDWIPPFLLACMLKS